MKFNALIPELAVSDIAVSKAFYRDLLDFSVEYERPEEGFAFMSLGEAQIMLDQLDIGRTFASGALEPPLGRGCNLQIAVAPGQLEAMIDAIRTSGRSFHLPPEECWYRQDNLEHGQRQFVTADPDGYLLRFMTSLETRRAGQ